MTAKKERCYIVGFAPSWTETPWDDAGAERWGLNSLHRVASGRPFDRWFQLHDLKKFHSNDHEHLSWLAGATIPVYMWSTKDLPVEVPMAIRYPLEEVKAYFAPYPYFTNSVSWMLAIAIMEGFSEVHIYGVDMAQDSEYSFQRPSCEWAVGWAQGAGIKIHIPPTADLMKSTHLYGAEDASIFMDKLDDRITDLAKRQSAHETEAQQHREATLQLSGALENARWIKKAWTPPRLIAEPPEGPTTEVS